MQSAAGVGWPHFSPLNSPLRSSEGRFLLTVLEGEVVEWSPSAGAGDKALPLDDGGEFVSLRGALWVVEMDIVARKG